MMKEIVYTIFADSRTVFRVNDIALMLNSTDVFLSQKLNKLVNEGMLLNLRKGIYAKKNYNPVEYMMRRKNFSAICSRLITNAANET
jgi:hypothetical protein